MPNIVLTRIDNRLIHGQVATAWTQYSGANLLLVPNDDVSTNPTRQTLLHLKGFKQDFFLFKKLLISFTKLLIDNL